MSNPEVVESWVHAMLQGQFSNAKAPNLRADGKYLVSYDTPVAKYKDGRFLITQKKYSVTTSKHVSLAKHYAPVDLIDYVPEIISCKGRFPNRW